MFYFIIMEILLLLVIVYFLFYILSYSVMGDFETSSSYECGFDVISKTRAFFSYRFFLISILFLVFDVEIVLMLSIPYMSYSIKGVCVFGCFVLILIIGLIYEYFNGMLDWL